MRGASGGGLYPRLLILVGVAGLPLVVALGLSVSNDYGSERKSAQSQLLGAAERIKASYDQLVSNTEVLLASMSTALTVSGFPENASCNLFMRSALEPGQPYANLVATDANGLVICSAAPLPASDAPMTFAERPYFRTPRDARKFVVLPLTEGPILQRIILPMAYPWTLGDEFRGVLLAPVGLDQLNRMLRSVNLPHGSRATLHDQEGNMAASTEGVGAGSGIDRKARSIAAGTGRSSTFEAEDDVGVRHLYAATFVGDRTRADALVILVKMPASLAYDGSRRGLTAALVGLLLGAVFLIAASLLGTKVILVRPLRMLGRAMERVSRGELTAETVEVKGVGEIRTLSRAFNNMTDALHDRTTRLKVSEERFRSMVHTNPAVTFLAAADGTPRFLEMSRQVEGLLGVPAEEIIADPALLLDRLEPESRERWFEALRRCLDTGEPVGLDVAFIMADGRPGWVRVEAGLVYDGEGKVMGVQGLTLDITDRVTAEQELAGINVTLEERITARTAELVSLNGVLASANRGLAEVNAELEAFSYSVSHDLRAPLRAISGFARLIEVDHAEELSDEARRLFDRIQQASERMGRLIDDLLDLTKVGRGELNVVAVDLSALARKTLASLAQSDPDRSVQLRIQDDLVVFGDALLTRVLIENLLGNAWKFTSRQPHALIEVGSAADPDDPTRTVVVVRDNGAGFDMAYVDKLFHPFQRLHTAQEYPGTGVGLAIVRRIVERHQGKVWAEGHVDQGATVSFRLADSAVPGPPAAAVATTRGAIPP